MKKEIWRTIKNFPAYEVSNFGNVRRGANLLAPFPDKDSYLCVYLYRAGVKRENIRVHTLVAEAFHGRKPKNKEVNHKSLVKTNNRADNLEYLTRRQNMQHFWRLKRASIAAL